jgi:hypothetical protein
MLLERSQDGAPGGISQGGEHAVESGLLHRPIT